MKKILIPIDFSEVSENALIIATEIARKTQAVVELLHIIESPIETEFKATGEISLPDGMDKIFILKSIDLAQRKFEEIIDNVKYVGVRFITKIKIGDPYHHFTKHIVEESSDLIIMGTGGSDGFLKGIFNKTNTERVVMKANSMVLAVKNDTKNFKMRNVIFASDLSEDSSEFIKKINTLQNIFDFRLHLLYVNPLLNYTSNLNKLKEKMDRFITEHRIKNCTGIIEEDLTEFSGIINYSNKVDADIIALSTHQHKGWHFLGGVSDDLVNFANKPILTYKTN